MIVKTYTEAELLCLFERAVAAGFDDQPWLNDMTIGQLEELLAGTADA